MNKLFLLFSFVLGFYFTNVYAEPLQIIDTIKNRYNQTNAFDAKFQQTLIHKESGSQETRNGRLQFQKPLLIRWETQKPNEETLIINKDEVWDYLPDEKMAFKYSPEVVQDSRNIIQVLTGQAALNRDFNVKEKGRENGLTSLQLYPKDPTPQLVEAMIWVEPDTGYIKRAKITDFYGNINDVKFTNFSTRDNLPSSRFKFSPPKGVEIQDNAEKNIQERELFK